MCVPSAIGALLEVMPWPDTTKAKVVVLAADQAWEVSEAMTGMRTRASVTEMAWRGSCTPTALRTSLKIWTKRWTPPGAEAYRASESMTHPMSRTAGRKLTVRASIRHDSQAPIRPWLPDRPTVGGSTLLLARVCEPAGRLPRPLSHPSINTRQEPAPLQTMRALDPIFLPRVV